MPTALCRRLGLDVPIVQAPMNWATDARMVSAVAEAGGLGVLGPNAGPEPPSTDSHEAGERMRRQIHETRRRTSRPFAVNVPIGMGGNRTYSDRVIEVLVEERVGVAITVTGSPEVYTARLKAAGTFVIHAIASVKHAVKAEECGVDAVVAEGFDAGGHSGYDELPMSVLAPQVADRVRIPVIAAGGIVDGRSLVAALATGAQAVSMGSRFMATVECPIHEDVKRAIVAAGDTSTISWGRKTAIARTLRNRFTDRFRALEHAGASREELNAFIDEYDRVPGGRRVGGLRGGDLEEGEIYLGAGAGGIRDVPTCAELIRRTMHEAAERAAELATLLRPDIRQREEQAIGITTQ